MRKRNSALGRFLVLAALLLSAALACAQHTFPALDTNNTFTGSNNFSNLSIPPVIFAKLPPPGYAGRLQPVSDGNTTCTAGGGSTACLFEDTGAAWVVVSASGTNLVSSVFGRTGTVTAQSGDYTASQVSGLGSAATASLSGNAAKAASTSVTNDTSGQAACWDGSHNVTNSGCSSASGTVTDGSGVTTANELAVSTTTAHQIQYVTTLPTAAMPAAHAVSSVLLCADSSGSGTAQSCTTAPSFTPTTDDCIVYTTTTANTGSGLTLNVNSLGAKSVAKWHHDPCGGRCSRQQASPGVL